jgi:hypothetical protein
LYWGTANLNGHVTVASDYTVAAGTGKITIRTADPPNSGAFSLNTCGGPPASTSWTVGQYFQHGWYVEYAGEWDATGHTSNQTGFYGVDFFFYPSCPTPGTCWEIDDPDAFTGWNQSLHYWDGGSLPGRPVGQPLNPSSGYGPPTIETGDRWGVLSTQTGVTYWFNDLANGTVVFNGGDQTALNFYNSKQCFGPESQSVYATTVDSIKVWQAAPLNTPIGGARRPFRH